MVRPRPFSQAGIRPSAVRRWLSACPRPWPGMCLSTGRMPPCSSPSAMARGDGRHSPGVVAIGAVADHRVGAGDRHVGQRQAIDGDAEGDEVGGDQPAPRRAAARPSPGSMIVQRADTPRRRVDRPMRRAEALHPAALLIDQDRGIGLPTRSRIPPTSRATCAGDVDVALEQDEAPRPLRAEKRALFGGQCRAGYAGDECAWLMGPISPRPAQGQGNRR